MNQKLRSFFAYPSSPFSIGEVIESAIDKVNSSGRGHIEGWKENDVSGRPLTAPIFRKIDDCNLLVADVTKLNFNVTFEIGYAIANQKRVFLVRSKEYKEQKDLILSVGLFDTLGYEPYSNASDLARKIQSVTDLTAIPLSRPLNNKQPVYILETPIKGAVTARIVSRVKKSRLPFRSFTPSEESRLSALSAIDHVLASYGIIVPILDQDMTGSEIHNIRAAFIAGLALGLEKELLVLQSEGGPVPLDARDITSNYFRQDDIDDHIAKFAENVYEKLFDTNVELQGPVTKLAQLNIGDPMAENEFEMLGKYFVQTDEFQRALRGEVNLVVGRKGTGKTALFSQVRNKKRSNRRNIVIDLKPEGYQLLKLKDEVLDFLADGAKAHLIIAFWEFLLYMEIAHKVLEKDRQAHLSDESIYKDYISLKEIYDRSALGSTGDFSERLMLLSESITEAFSSSHGKEVDVKLTAPEVTNLLHSEHILEIRRILSVYLKKKDAIWLLFDNLDKGWASGGVNSGDITILRCLIDASRKVRRDLTKDKIQFHGLIFIRNDVYQLLMDKSADFGKESRASLDWDDADLLRELLRKRFVASDFPKDSTFDQIWKSITIPLFEGEETSQYLIERSLMRPRNLLKLLQFCKGFAVNLQHDRIEEEDIRKGLKSYSNDLIVDADQELTDIDPSARHAIYSFIGEQSSFSREELEIVLDSQSTDPHVVDQILEFFLYYGFMGIQYANQEPQYIYSVGYDLQILKTRIRKNAQAIKYILNPAFWPALEIKPW